MTEYAPIVPHLDRYIPVIVSVSSIDDRGVLLKVETYHDEVLATDISPAELFEHGDWLVTSTTHHFDRRWLPERLEFSTRKVFADLNAIDTELQKLRYEEGGTNGDRYKELSGPLGLVRLTECRRDVLRLVAQFAILAVTGMWPTELERLGL